MVTNVTEKEFQDTVVRKVRKDSKKLVLPTSVNDLAEIFHELEPIAFENNLAQVIADDEYADIKQLKAFTGAKYLYSNKHMTETLAMVLARSEEIKPMIVNKVRKDSKEGKPTSINVFPALIPDLSKNEMEACYAEIAGNSSYQDVKSIVAFNGAIYYYSELTLNRDLAVRQVRSAELQKKIVDKVRGDSKYLSELTKIDTLLSLAPDLELDEVQAAITELKSKEQYLDIELLTAKNESKYLFSQRHMTMSYAQILLRAEVNNPAYTIAETVREDSKVYPRPTNIEIFKYGLFNIDRERLEEYVDQAMEEYEDLMLLDIDGTVFLYSNLYMTEEQAILVAAGARREN